MKIALRRPQQAPPMSAPGKLERAVPEVAELPTALSGAQPEQQQLALATHSRKSTGTRALCRKTYSAVEGWLERLFVSERGSGSHKKRRKELKRRASTGSLLGRAAVEARAGPVSPSRLKRASSLFSPRSDRKESASSSASPSATAPRSKSSKRSDTKLWLTPVASFSDLVESGSCAAAAATATTTPVAVSPTTVEFAPVVACTGTSDVKMEEEHEGRAAKPESATPGPELELFSYVVPPVEMPNTYRIQDRRGGTIVAGRAVLFTNAAFKRRLRNLRNLRAIPEHEPAVLLDAHLDVYLYGLQRFGASRMAGVQDVEPLSEWI